MSTIASTDVDGNAPASGSAVSCVSPGFRMIETVSLEVGGVTKTTFPPVLPAGVPVSAVLMVTPSDSIVSTPLVAFLRITWMSLAAETDIENGKDVVTPFPASGPLRTSAFGIVMASGSSAP